MSLTFHLATATLYEQEQLLRAAFNLSPNIPAFYYAHISTTQPAADGTGITEYSGNGYAPVKIPVWRNGALAASQNDPTLPFGQQTIEFAYAIPDAVVQFPNPTAPWWANGTTFYVYLTDAAVGGNVRWWWQKALTPAPSPGNALALGVIDPADGVTPLTAIGCAIQAIAVAPTRINSNLAAFAITAMTSLVPVNTDPAQAAVGNHFNWDGTDSASPNEPSDLSDDTFCAGFNYYTTTGTGSYPAGWKFLAGTSFEAADTGSGPQIGVSSLSDTSYVRKTVAWEIATDAGGYKICRNSAAIDWTIGADVEDHHVSGASLPSVFPGALHWSRWWPFGVNTLLRGSPNPLVMAFPDATAVSVPASSAYIDHYEWVFFPWQPYLLAGDNQFTRTNSTTADYSAWNYLFEIRGDGSAYNASFGTLSATDYVIATSDFYGNPTWLSNTVTPQIVNGAGSLLGFSGQTWAAGDHFILDAHSLVFRIR